MEKLWFSRPGEEGRRRNFSTLSWLTHGLGDISRKHGAFSFRIAIFILFHPFSLGIGK